MPIKGTGSVFFFPLAPGPNCPCYVSARDHSLTYDISDMLGSLKCMLFLTCAVGLCYYQIWLEVAQQERIPYCHISFHLLVLAEGKLISSKLMFQNVFIRPFPGA